MRFWSVLVSADRFAAERIVERDAPAMTCLDASGRVSRRDRVALIANTTPAVVFGLCTVERVADGDDSDRDDSDRDDSDRDDSGPRSDAPSGRVFTLAYTHRFFDEPLPATGIGPVTETIREITAAAFDTLVPPPTVLPQRRWLVSVDLPIEAASAAEAVRQFWSYVRELGPAELPAFVRPSDDELAMQAYVLGAPANLDPEEEG